MKKIYFQTNIFFQILMLLILSTFFIAQYFAIKILILIFSSILEINLNMLIIRIIIFLVFEVSAILILKIFLRFEQNNIYIDKNVIYMNDDKKKNNNKIQYATRVQVEEIVDIKIIWSNKDSRLKSSISSSIPIAYISFLLKNGCQKNMMILFMNKSTVKKLINNIKRLMIEYNNKNQIADTELLISKLKNNPKHKGDK